MERMEHNENRMEDVRACNRHSITMRLRMWFLHPVLDAISELAVILANRQEETNLNLEQLNTVTTELVTAVNENTSAIDNILANIQNTGDQVEVDAAVERIRQANAGIKQATAVLVAADPDTEVPPVPDGG